MKRNTRCIASIRSRYVERMSGRSVVGACVLTAGLWCFAVGRFTKTNRTKSHPKATNAFCAIPLSLYVRVNSENACADRTVSLYVQPTDGYGAFHQRYKVDGKVIAVGMRPLVCVLTFNRTVFDAFVICVRAGVVDVLPCCLSGVYFFYDPAFAHLSPGVFAALTEIEWVQKAVHTKPRLQYYYMARLPTSPPL
jgi:hypothetical protein